MISSVRALTLALLIASPASAQQTDEGRFDVVLRGIKAGQLVFQGVQSGNNYAVAGKVQSTGLVGRLVKFSYDAKARGSYRNGRYTPTEYTEAADTGKRQSTSVMRYRSGVPQVRDITPPRAAAAYDLKPSTQGGTIDPLTAVYALLRDVDAARACQVDLKMFDGRRRSQITLKNPTPQADGSLLCSGEYRRLGGFSPEDMAERSRFPLTMRLTPVGDKMRVTEIRTPTLYGDAILRRK